MKQVTYVSAWIIWASAFTDFKIHLITALTISRFVIPFVCLKPVAVGITICDADAVVDYGKVY